VYAREGQGVKLDADPGIALRDVSIFDLISAFNEALKKVKKEDLTEIFGDRFTVAEKIDQISETIRAQGRLRLSVLFEKMRHRYEMVCTFLAVLELMRLRQIRVQQEAHFGEIEIVPYEV
jgi:segregation and condensation protein A